MRKIYISLLLGIASLSNIVYGQINVKPDIFYIDTSSELNQASSIISDETYRIIDEQINANVQKLGLNLRSANTTNEVTLLDWPLKPTANFKGCDHYYISAFVDQDKTTGSIGDYNCGSRTYDGHRGIDLVPWPFIWDNMDNNLIEVVAAAQGTIVAKVDGAFDRICGGYTGSEPINYIAIQHSNGSRTLYLHLKNGSLTSKIIGESVNTGEYLGIPGSSGPSTGVHLHFEVRSDGTFANYIDPYYGTCNAYSTETWWASQKPYTEPAILKVAVQSYWPYMATCPNTVDTTYAKSVFLSTPGAEAIFSVFSKFVSTGMSWNCRILNPDNSVYSSWNYTSSSTRTISSLGWGVTLPETLGIYTFEATFNGGSPCSTNFTITDQISSVATAHNTLFSITQNKGILSITCEKPITADQNYVFNLYNISGQKLLTEEITHEKQDIQTQTNTGIYTYSILENGKLIKSGKIVLN